MPLSGDRPRVKTRRLFNITKMRRYLLGLIPAAALALGHPQSPLFITSLTPVQAQEDASLVPMTVVRLDRILDDVADSVEGSGGQRQVSINGQTLVVLMNEEFDRMRIVAPIASAEELTPAQAGNILIANFHTTLDARYAVSDGTVVATYLHPFSTLQEQDLRSAMRQVASLVETFGTTYTSGELLFGPNGEPVEGAVDGGLQI
ncbi:MAG: hypothetical protein ACFB4J_19810 [Elainellaceae cyanobacterium]